MPLDPVVNGGVAFEVRRPRLTIVEGTAVSGPFPLQLFANDPNKTDPYCPAPNVIGVNSSRIAITETNETPETFPWGQDYTYNGAVRSIGTLVGWLWVLSVDANADGYDDLEVAANVTLADALTTFGQGIVESQETNFAVTGNIELSGSVAATADTPFSVEGAIELSGSVSMQVGGFFSVRGDIELSGSVEATADMPFGVEGAIELSGDPGTFSVSAGVETFYGRNTARSPGYALETANGATMVENTLNAADNMVKAQIGTARSVGKSNAVYTRDSVTVTANANTAQMQIVRYDGIQHTTMVTFVLPTGKSFVSGNTYTISMMTKCDEDIELGGFWPGVKWGDASDYLSITGTFGS